MPVPSKSCKIKFLWLCCFWGNLIFASTNSINQCPAVQQIKEQGIYPQLELLANHSWVATYFHHYQTDYYWKFMLGNIHASDEQQAYHIALEALNDLTFVSGPAYSALSESWICKYQSNDGISAITLTNE